MRPQKRKDKKQKRKPNKKRKIHQTHKRPCYIHNIETSDFDSINQIIRDHKYQLKDIKKTWKIVPKDSCEVYKNRRNRKDETVSERNKEEGNQREDSNGQRVHTKRRVRRPLKRDSRGRFLPESSKCSCCTRTNTDTDTTYTPSEAAYDD